MYRYINHLAEEVSGTAEGFAAQQWPIKLRMQVPIMCNVYFLTIVRVSWGKPPSGYAYPPVGGSGTEYTCRRGALICMAAGLQSAVIYGIDFSRIKITWKGMYKACNDFPVHHLLTIDIIIILSMF